MILNVFYTILIIITLSLLPSLSLLSLFWRWGLSFWMSRFFQNILRNLFEIWKNMFKSLIFLYDVSYLMFSHHYFFIWFFGFRGGQNMYPKPYEFITRRSVCNCPAWAAAYLGGTEELRTCRKKVISEKGGTSEKIGGTRNSWKRWYVFIWFYFVLYDFMLFLHDLICSVYESIRFLYDCIWFLYDSYYDNY